MNTKKYYTKTEELKNVPEQLKKRKFYAVTEGYHCPDNYNCPVMR